jgi:beta-amylase
MASLHVELYNYPTVLEAADWDNFAKELAIARSIGVDAISVDVWWGDVESKGDQQFDWPYYDKEFSYIIAAGLHIMPIMSFHQCGGGVGDDYTSLLPGWLWDKIKQNDTVEDMKYRSELGNYSNEYVSLWADSYVMKPYQEFITAFADFCNHKKCVKYIDEVNISCGPSGEFRYPSYSNHDSCYDEPGKIVKNGGRTGWPYRGALQCYGDLALKDFQTKMSAKYGNTEKQKGDGRENEFRSNRACNEFSLCSCYI